MKTHEHKNYLLLGKNIMGRHFFTSPSFMPQLEVWTFLTRVEMQMKDLRENAELTYQIKY
jgi:hypothetical protein